VLEETGLPLSRAAIRGKIWRAIRYDRLPMGIDPGNTIGFERTIGPETGPPN